MEEKWCKYKYNYWHCEEQALPDSEFCILHIDFPRDTKDWDFEIMAQFKKEKVKEKINKEDFNFEGAKVRLKDIDFEEDIKSDLNFINAVIYGPVNFRKAKISGNVDFSGAKIIDYINYHDTQIKGNVNFIGAKISGDIDFSGAEISGYAYFGNAKIDRNVNFDYAEINGIADFHDTEISGGVEFTIKGISGDVIFAGAKIKGNVNFAVVEIGGNVNFGLVNIDGYVNFGSATINGNVGFAQSRINGNVNFSGAEIIGDIGFVSAKINGNADFSFRKFKYAHFEEASFLSKGSFTEIKEFNASFEGAVLKNVAFRNCDLTNVRFKQTFFENCELSTSEWKDKIKIPEHREYEKEKNKKNGKYEKDKKVEIEDLETVADTYRRIKQCLQEEGAYDQAGDFYIKEMDMRRRVYWRKNKVHKIKNKLMWLFYTFLSIISGYGERPIRTAACFFVVVVLFTFYYWSFDAIIIQGSFNRFLGTFCYSMLTSIALSYNNLQPKEGLPVIVSALEGIVGTFLVAMFVYVFARKMSR